MLSFSYRQEAVLEKKKKISSLRRPPLPEQPLTTELGPSRFPASRYRTHLHCTDKFDVRRPERSAFAKHRGLVTI